jgi:hypothetical protein
MKSIPGSSTIHRADFTPHAGKSKAALFLVTPVKTASDLSAPDKTILTSLSVSERLNKEISDWSKVY